MPCGTSVQTKLYGGTVSEVIDVVPWKYSTLAMEPSVSATWTMSGMFAGALKAALLLGLISVTLGSEFTITVTAADVALAPRLSVAVAVRLRSPAAALLRVTLYGALVAVPIRVAPL